MTTTLVIVLDPPQAALHDADPIAWTAGYVRGKLLESGLVVHDCEHRPEVLLGVERHPPAPGEPTVYHCPLPWCRKEFSQQHHVKMHMRSHTDQDCQWCHRSYKLTGLDSHERSCSANPANANKAKAKAEPLPKLTPWDKPDARGVSRRRGRRKAEPAAPQPIVHDLGPIERRPFDPDAVRAAAFAGAFEKDGDPFA